LSFNISAKSQNKEAAWGLIKAFATREAGEAQAKVVIPAYEGSANVWKNNWPNLDLQCFIDAASYADLVPATIIASAAQDDIELTWFDNIWLGGVSVAEACAAIDRESAAAVDEAGGSR
jgi:multiple sugar transport system substrate-binding protein